jgi:hypothetical protein
VGYVTGYVNSIGLCGGLCEFDWVMWWVM